MLNSTGVQLTRVHFYDPNRSERNIEIPTISREVFRCNFHKNPIIKKNIFGHKWVLKISEDRQDQKPKWINGKLIVYVWVFCCIIVAVSFGIYFSIESKYFPAKNQTNVESAALPNQPTQTPNLRLIEHEVERVRKFITIVDKIDEVVIAETPPVIQDNVENLEESFEESAISSTPANGGATFCRECVKNEEICLKTEEFHAPICVGIRDARDPSGCGGLCELNTQRCKRLHSKMDVFQCVKDGNVLRCPAESFSCGNMCIPRYKRCDGVVDCSNMADERNCECDMNIYFHCGNSTSCIEKTRRCNGIIDCWDKSDEISCHEDCENDEEPCLNGECIKKEYFCDGTYHCTDKSDELPGC